ncbi:MAG: hypothetical protein KBS82_05625 [Oscillospiraceae bacterium]|nr:hypothetical protein [Candidatus Limimonas egerieequi]
MPSGKRICKICGCEYPYCKTAYSVDKYRWQDVCCSPEHAAIYFHDIAVSRGEIIDDEPKAKSIDSKKKSKKAEPKVEIVEEESDDDFEIDEEEDEEEFFLDDDE